MPVMDMLATAPDSILFWVIVAVLVCLALYLSREQGHQAILSLTQALHRTFRFAAAATVKTEQRLAARNREVLLAAGREAAEREIEREFERMEAAVNRDLAECPALHRRMNEAILNIEEDLQASVEVPPSPPGWVSAVDSVARIPDQGDGMVSQILEKIHDSMVKAHEQAMTEYRATVKERHERLKALMPFWRRLSQLITKADRNIAVVRQRAKVIDRYILEYEQILQRSDRALGMLSSSSLVQFFVSAFVLVIAIGGAVINFHLIARPMAEMVGGNNLISSFKISDIAALVIILVEMSMGLFLMESLRITRLFPVIGALPDVMRVRMLWVTFGILACLASVEAGLAYMREILLQDELATSALLRGEVTALTAEFAWITTAAQMGMGFILPFALVFVAIPLETFVSSLRTVLGLILGAILRGFAIALRAIGGSSRTLGYFLVDVYDVIIFLPLWAERQIRPSGNADIKPAEAAKL